MKRFPVSCPSCSEKLSAARLVCRACDTAVEGDFSLPLLAQLGAEDQAFVVQFIQSSGSLKEMAKHLGVSYPTVRNRLNEIIATLQSLKPESHE